ncbi:type I methionyl aminopeptidase [Candidatus Roizmanbacteria bacterium RIFCSPHIGHO2_12_FULL_42_10]|uniref:Methionine aminopeptidase n=1 Tax=Candidatus Roizmanbacteria bacterium RIFCSPHIGHO2_12_FULL_42_10 TaxID=1802053 RepID=A0A1F7I5G9_9BACT|nr:MAG: type I methionyl aminopeptidase [Candidatus Roizmanbacteria bacterium RIFCSPHIGHO2_12_FULL_42_10]
MIRFKSEKEIQDMRIGGKMLHEVILFAEKNARSGITTLELNNILEKKILSLGGEPGFKKVHGYSWASCICINEQIVHTPPSERVIKDGDVVTIDIGVFYNGLHTDSATTIQVPPNDSNVTHFLETGRKALRKAIKVAYGGNRIGHISLAFQSTIEEQGYSIVKELTGHGVGTELHEDPYIPCFLDKPLEKTLKLQQGMTLALEVMYTMGKSEITHESGGWSIRSADHSVAATFEASVALMEKETFILT